MPELRSHGAARSAQWARDQLRDCAGFWVHVDVDVLDPAVMPAVDAPDVGGIAYRELEILLSGLVSDPRCVGVEVTVFDPDYDPDGQYAREVTDVLVAGLEPLVTSAALAAADLTPVVSAPPLQAPAAVTAPAVVAFAPASGPAPASGFVPAVVPDEVPDEEQTGGVTGAGDGVDELAGALADAPAAGAVDDDADLDAEWAAGPVDEEPVGQVTYLADDTDAPADLPAGLAAASPAGLPDSHSTVHPGEPEDEPADDPSDGYADDLAAEVEPASPDATGATVDAGEEIPPAVQPTAEVPVAAFPGGEADADDGAAAADGTAADDDDNDDDAAADGDDDDAADDDADDDAADLELPPVGVGRRPDRCGGRPRRRPGDRPCGGGSGRAAPASCVQSRRRDRDHHPQTDRPRHRGAGQLLGRRLGHRRQWRRRAGRGGRTGGGRRTRRVDRAPPARRPERRPGCRAARRAGRGGRWRGVAVRASRAEGPPGLPGWR